MARTCAHSPGTRGDICFEVFWQAEGVSVRGRALSWGGTYTRSSACCISTYELLGKHCLHSSGLEQTRRDAVVLLHCSDTRNERAARGIHHSAALSSIYRHLRADTMQIQQNPHLPQAPPGCMVSNNSLNCPTISRSFFSLSSLCNFSNSRFSSAL